MNLKELIGVIAPTVASAALGPVGGAVAAALGSIIGVEKPTIETVTKAIANGQLTNDQLAEIRQLELEYQAKEKELGYRYAEIEFQNTKSARDMQIATRSWIPGALSIGITAGFFGILLFMLVGEYRPTEPLLVMLGALGTAWGSVVNFYFGSSHSSHTKTELLARAEPIK
jgi:hypothetical protein